MCVEMCGQRDVALDSPTVTTAGGEATGQDKSSAAGIFVLTVEHVHGGGGVLAFVLVLALTLSLLWCCAKRRLPWCRVAGSTRTMTPVARVGQELPVGFPHWRSLNERF